MRYFYISRNAILRGEVVCYDIFDMPLNLEAYRTGAGKEDTIEYIGDNIPNDWEYDVENDVLFSASDRPSPYHVFIKGVWIIKDKEGYRKYCDENIDKIKAEILEYGFDYQGHQQKCRDKDIAYMVANIVALQTAKDLGITKKVTWYFSDNYGMESGPKELGTLMLYGTTFVQSVYNTENYFKTLEEPKFISKEDFETKRKEIHQVLAGA